MTVVSRAILIIFFIFSAVVTSVFKSKVNIFDSDLRKCFLSVSSSRNLSNSSCTCLDSNVRTSRTPFLESALSPFLNKYSSGSVVIASNSNVLLIIDSVSFTRKPKTFSDVVVVFVPTLYLNLFSDISDILEIFNFLTIFYGVFFFLKRVTF